MKKGPFALSSNQKRLWIIYQQNKLNPAYNINLTYRIKGRIDYEVLSKSMNILFNEQHVLSSTFKDKDGEPYIMIESKPVNIKIIDFSAKARNERKEAILSFVGQDDVYYRSCSSNSSEGQRMDQILWIYPKIRFNPAL